MIRIDYHFHPNFNLKSNKKQEKRAKKIWQAFKKNKLNLVLVSEHAYKNPKKSFEILQKFRPIDSETYLVPAIECISKEGVDIIAFGKNPNNIYSHRELLTPKFLRTTDMIDFIKSKEDLYGIIVHPHVPSRTGIVRTHGKEFSIKAVKELGFLEKHNCSFNGLIRLMDKTYLSKIFAKKYRQLTDTQTAPKYLQLEAKIMTLGSDAHHPADIGDYKEVNKKFKQDYEHLFKVAISKGSTFHLRQDKPIMHLGLNGFSVVKESILKSLKFYSVDQPHEQRIS